MVHGQTLTFTLTVTNILPVPRDGVRLVDTVSGGVIFMNAFSTQGTCSFTADTVDCNIGTVAPGATITVAISVTPTGSQPILVNNAGVFVGEDVDPSCVATPQAVQFDAGNTTDVPALSRPMLALLALVLAGAAMFVLRRLS